MTVIGFTGTRDGMSVGQKLEVAARLKDPAITEAHHGDCLGADAEFHELCIKAGIFVVIHPPKMKTYRAYCQLTSPSRGREVAPRDYLARNKAIVAACDALIAAPKENHEPLPARGQGTWSTVRYARSMKTPMLIVWP